MATISSPGVGSGLDVNSIVTQLAALERRPLAGLQTAATFVKTQISAFGQVQSLVSSLGDAASKLAQGSLWKQATAGTSDATALGARASAGATPGSYQVRVTQLAEAQALASARYASATAVVGAGRLTIERGSWNGDASVFSGKSGSSAVSIDITDPNATLSQVRDRINVAQAGVTASIVNDVSGARLTLRSNDTGLENGLRIGVTDLGGAPITAGLGALAYAPDAGAGALAYGLNDTWTGLVQTRPALNALAEVNGLTVENASNQMSSVLDGVALTLLKTTASPVGVTVSNDSGAQRKAIQEFVTAYNAVNNYLAEQTKYDEANKVGGTLQGDSAAVGLRNQLRGLLRETSSASSMFGQLRLVGFDVQRDGSIVLDNARLDAALAQPAELGKLFGDTSPSGEQRGLAWRFNDLTKRLAGSSGSLELRNEGLKAKLKRNQTEQDRVEARAERVRERLLRQYQALDAKVGQLNNLSSYVSQQLTMLNSQFQGSNDR